MCQPVYNFLISRGITNLVEIDGLVYAPVQDLLLAFVEFGFLIVLLVLLVIGAAWYLGETIDCNRPSADG